MKDYSITKRDLKTFILNYERNDNEILVHVADSNNDYIIPYTIHNEQILLERMKKQVLEVSKYKENIKNNCGLYIRGGTINTVLLLLEPQAATYNITKVTLISGLSLIIIYFSKKIGICIEILEDINKNEMFVANEELLNKYITGEKITINDVDYLSSRELKKMIRYATNKEKDVSRKR